MSLLMDADIDNDGRFPDGAAVLTPYPLTDEQAEGARSEWPWVAGTIDQQCGPDEWGVVVEDREAAVLEGGVPAPDDTPDDELCYPIVFRDSSEIRLRSS